MKYSVIISAVLLCGASLAFAYTDKVSFFAFVTPPQTVLSDTLSQKITIQSQNKEGLLEAVSETFDIVFKSSSPTGLFLGSTGKPASKVMSKNTANKNFYYKDSGLGESTITVEATGRQSKRLFFASQKITVSNELPVVTKIVEPKATVSNVVANTEQKEEVSIETSEVEVFSAPAKKGLLSRIFQFIKHLFIEEN